VVTFDGSKSTGYTSKLVNCTPAPGCFETCEPEFEAAVETYHWDFGDGVLVETTEAKVTHAYSTAGTYTVKLTVTSAKKTGGAATQEVPVADRPPTAAFTPPSSPTATAVTTFNASASADPDGTIVKYQWEFGDGATQETTVPTIGHTYSSAGTFEVALTVTDNSGNTGKTKHSISVIAAPSTSGTGSGGGAGSTGGTSGSATGGGSGTATASISSIGPVSTSSQGGKILVDTGEVVDCPAGSTPCQITVQANSQPNGRAASASGRKKATKKILIGQTTLALAPGKVGKLTFRLNAKGAALLRRLKHLGATLTVTVRYGSAKPLVKTGKITIKAPRPSKRGP
jgi:PKD repeat protein